MPISIAELTAASGRSYRASVIKSVNEVLAKSKQTAFLCHSHKDEKLAEGLQRRRGVGSDQANNLKLQ